MILVSSRLLEYGLRVTLHTRGLIESHGQAARLLKGGVSLLDLARPVLSRALDPFPGPTFLRTLDALHLASCVFLADLGQKVELATYGRRMEAAERDIEIPLNPLLNS